MQPQLKRLLFVIAAVVLGCSHPPAPAPVAARAAATMATPAAAAPAPLAPLPRLVAYVNCLCGFGVGTSGGACSAEPDPKVNHVRAWEEHGESPITQYVIAFLSFSAQRIVTDAAPVWASGGGSVEDFELEEHLRDALRPAQARGKQIWLSLGGELGSSTFLDWWRARGDTREARIAAMRAEIERVAARFLEQNQLRADGFDLAVELGGRYRRDSPAYSAISELITAVPETYAVALVPQISNGLCAARAMRDELGPGQLMMGACRVGGGDDDSAWSLALLDRELKRSDGRPRLEYLGLQYYNEGEDACCGGGRDAIAMVKSAAQHYTNLANGWRAGGDILVSPPGAPLEFTQAWPGFSGVGPERLVLGKPACLGCARDNYLDLAGMQRLLSALDGRLAGQSGGLLFWELCRLFGHEGGLCTDGQCEPSWREHDARASLAELKRGLDALRPRPHPAR